MDKVIIYRGLPGSGKSTEAGKAGGVIVSSDDYFMDGGVYRFNAARLGEAHIACMDKFLYHIENSEELIVVDNTNTKLFELSPYRLVALASGYEVEIVRMVCDPIQCAIRNVHGVPGNTIMRMHKGFEDVPTFMGGERFIGPAV